MAKRLHDEDWNILINDSKLLPDEIIIDLPSTLVRQIQKRTLDEAAIEDSEDCCDPKKPHL